MYNAGVRFLKQRLPAGVKPEPYSVEHKVSLLLDQYYYGRSVRYELAIVLEEFAPELLTDL